MFLGTSRVFDRSEPKILSSSWDCILMCVIWSWSRLSLASIYFPEQSPPLLGVAWYLARSKRTFRFSPPDHISFCSIFKFSFEANFGIQMTMPNSSSRLYRHSFLWGFSDFDIRTSDFFCHSLMRRYSLVIPRRIGGNAMYVLAISIFASVINDDVGNFLVIVFSKLIFWLGLFIPWIIACWKVA